MSKFTYTGFLLSSVFVAGVLVLLASFVAPIGGPGTLQLVILALIIFAGLLAAHRARWRWTEEVLVSALVLLTIANSSPEFMAARVNISLLVPCVVAAALLTPIWTFATFLVTFIGAMTVTYVRSGFSTEAWGPTMHVESLLGMAVIAVGISVASAMARSAQQAAIASAQRAQNERDQVEIASRELSIANEQLNQQIAQQSQLLDLVASLEMPAVQIADGVMFMPIVGHMDSRRAQSITARLLHEVSARRARLVILDVGGVAVMDTSVAQSLLNTARSLKLLGCYVVISGLSASVAITLTNLGIDLGDVKTVRSPQEALQLFAGLTYVQGSLAPA